MQAGRELGAVDAGGTAVASDASSVIPGLTRNLSPEVANLIDSVYEALCDDLNTPIAIATLFEAVKLVNGGKLAESDKVALKQLFENVVFGVLGLRDEETAGTSGKAEKALEGVMEIVLEDRRKARAEKNWAESDRIRDLLASFGITVKDTKEGATWTLD